MAKDNVYKLRGAEAPRKKTSIEELLDILSKPMESLESLNYKEVKELHSSLDTLTKECAKANPGGKYDLQIGALKKRKLLVKERLDRLERPQAAAQGTQQMAASL